MRDGYLRLRSRLLRELTQRLTCCRNGSGILHVAAPAGPRLRFATRRVRTRISSCEVSGTLNLDLT